MKLSDPGTSSRIQDIQNSEEFDLNSVLDTNSFSDLSPYVEISKVKSEQGALNIMHLNPQFRRKGR